MPLSSPFHPAQTLGTSAEAGLALSHTESEQRQELTLTSEPEVDIQGRETCFHSDSDA